MGPKLTSKTYLDEEQAKAKAKCKRVEEMPGTKVCKFTF